MSEELTKKQDCSAESCDQPTYSLRPAYRTADTDTGVTVAVALPGVNKDAIELTSTENVLTIRAKRENPIPEEWTPRQADRKPDHYLLQIRLHQSLDPEKTDAELSDGILQLQIAKREEALPRKITVN
jgi:HSP20 family protein